MTEHDWQFRRWAELVDRAATGEVLSADDAAFCERFAEQHAACDREQAVLDAISDLDAEPTAQSRALVDKTLARLSEEEKLLARLTEEALRAERAEVSRLRGGLRLSGAAWAGIAVAAAVLIAVSAGVLLKKPVPVAVAPAAPAPMARVELVYSSGEVEVDGKPADGNATLLAEGSQISVGHGSACLAIDPDIDVCAAAGSELVLSSTHGAWRRLDLRKGKVGVQLAPQPEGYHLSIVADGVWSTAVGTAFTVTEGEGGAVHTAVLHGKVRVGRETDASNRETGASSQERVVGAHQRAEVRGGDVTLGAMGRSQESAEWALLRPASLWRTPDRSASLVLHGQPAGAEVLLDEQSIGTAPIATLLPAGVHQLEVRASGKVLLARDLIAEVGQISTVRYDASALQDPAVELPQVQVQQVQNDGRHAAHAERARSLDAKSAADMLTEAHRLMRAESYQQAARQYEALRQAYPNSPEASTVLVSLAELQLDRLRRPAQALENLDRYLAGRNTTLAEEAQQARIRALHALGAEDDEADAITAFLSTHPRSFRAPALQSRLAELQAAR